MPGFTPLCISTSVLCGLMEFVDELPSPLSRMCVLVVISSNSARRRALGGRSRPAIQQDAPGPRATHLPEDGVR